MTVAAPLENRNQNCSEPRGKMPGSIENPEGASSHEIMMHSKSGIEGKGCIVKVQRR